MIAKFTLAPIKYKWYICTMNTEFQKYLDHIGGSKAAMQHLGLSQSMVFKVLKGERKLNVYKADQIVSDYPNLDFRKLVLAQEARQ